MQRLDNTRSERASRRAPSTGGAHHKKYVAIKEVRSDLTTMPAQRLERGRAFATVLASKRYSPRCALREAASWRVPASMVKPLPRLNPARGQAIISRFSGLVACGAVLFIVIQAW